MKKFQILSFILSSLFFLTECPADIAIMAGWAEPFGGGCDKPSYFAVNSLTLDHNFAPLIGSSHINGQILTVSTSSNTGSFILGGSTGLESYFTPAIYRGNVFSSSIEAIKIANSSEIGYLYCSAFDSKGTAILGGQEAYTNLKPLAFKVEADKTIASNIIFPNTDEGIINAVAFFPDDTALLAGQDNTTGAPVIYFVSKGTNDAKLIPIPDPSIIGFINCIAIDSDGRAILAGQDITNNQTLIYSVKQHNLVAKTISIPNHNDGSLVYAIAMSSNGTAILGGSVNSESLIYKISPKSKHAKIIDTTNTNGGSLYSVAIGPNDIAILAGVNIPNTAPFAYKIPIDTLRVDVINVPDSLSGVFTSVSIGSQNIAVLTGSTTEGIPLIYKMSTTNGILRPISFASPFSEGIFITSSIYSYDGLYDVRRIAPYYNLEIDETKNILKKAGL